MPSATPDQLATAIEDVVQAGAKVINLNAALVESTSVGLRRLEQTLDFPASRNAIVVAAAGNQVAIRAGVWRWPYRGGQAGNAYTSADPATQRWFRIRGPARIVYDKDKDIDYRTHKRLMNEQERRR